MSTEIPVRSRIKFERVGITSKPQKCEIKEIVEPLVKWLQERRIEVLIDEDTASNLGGREAGLTRREIAARADLVVVLGGDGTLLATARSMESRRIPILAVNLGSLGFLTVTTPAELYSTLERVLAGDYCTERRARIEVEIVRGGKIVERSLALNDVVLNKGATPRLLDFEVWVDGQFVATYRADGLIVSTPTGSTAYSLAAGGPVIVPSVAAFTLTPICAHVLANRPMVLPDAAIIELVTTNAPRPVYLTVDGQEALTFASNDRARLKRSEEFIELVQSPLTSYFEILRQKLKWGER